MWRSLGAKKKSVIINHACKNNKRSSREQAWPDVAITHLEIEGYHLVYKLQ